MSMGRFRAISARARKFGTGGSIIPDVAVGAPSALLSGTSFAPFDTTSVIQTFTFDWLGASTWYAIFNRGDASPVYPPTTGIKVALAGGNPQRYSVTYFEGGVEKSINLSGVAFTNGSGSAGTQHALTHNGDGSISLTRLDTNVEMFRIAANLVNGIPAIDRSGTFFSMHGNVSGTNMSGSMTNMRAQGSAVPITITGATLGPGYRPTVNIDYTGAGHTGFNIQLETIGGTAIGAKMPATVSITSAGKAVLVAQTTFTDTQLATTVGVRVFEVINGTEVAGTSKLATVDMPSAAATFGANLMNPDSDVDFRRTANAYLNQSGSMPGGANTDADFYPIVNGIQRPIGPSDVSGRTRIVTWDGAGAVAELGGADCSFTEKTVIDANTYSYKETFNRFVSGDSAQTQRIPRPYIIINPTSGNATNHPTNIKIYDQGEDRTKIWSDSFVNFHTPANGLNGAVRFMDARNINGNYAVNMTWAMRTPMSSTRFGAGPDGLQIEKAIAFCNITGRDMWLPYPPNATDDYLTQLAIAIDTGANLSQGAIWSNGLAPGLKWYVERSNEVWNTGFGIYRENRLRYEQRTGIPQLGDGNGGVEQGLREHAYQYDKQMAVIMAAIPNWSTRIVRVFASQIGDIGGYNIVMGADGGFGRYVDALALAPYIQVNAGAVNALPDKTPTSLETLYTPAAIAVLANMANKKQIAKTNGHRFICYEGALDMAAGNDPPTYLNSFQIMAFRQSPSYYRMLYAHFSYWKANYGDLYMQYGDISGNPYYVYQWGLISIANEATPAYGLLALQDVQAGLPSRY